MICLTGVKSKLRWVYLSFLEHLQVESLDLVELEPQGSQRVLFLVRVLL